MARWLVMRRVAGEDIGVGDGVCEADCPIKCGDIESLILDKRERESERKYKNVKPKRLREMRDCYDGETKEIERDEMVYF